MKVLKGLAEVGFIVVYWWGAVLRTLVEKLDRKEIEIK